MDRMPAWADAVLVPLISLILAAILSALVILAIGEDPVAAVKLMVSGALGSTYGWGYTLYYATNFMFTGLAVAVAFHARMFNIGGEGQAMLGGLGVAVAKRGSHIVITTIMFNFIAAALLNYLLVNLMRPAGAMDPATAKFPETTHLPTLHDLLAPFGIAFSKAAPANISFLIAVLACVLVWVLIWRTRLGYEIRAFGHSETAAKYAGISPVKITVIAMLISGGLAGLMAINTTMGEAERLIMNATEGAGFIGIAVALMGRSHPFGVFLAAILFGFLYQGGAELALWTSIPRELIVVIQALVILFTGALDNMVRMPLEKLFLIFRKGDV
ncbi:putative ABC transporter permease protein YufP [Nymphon striatum]|nr:putative ABC transporter permease protein YufP [Nymphon striatum]